MAGAIANNKRYPRRQQCCYDGTGWMGMNLLPFLRFVALLLVWERLGVMKELSRGVDGAYLAAQPSSACCGVSVFTRNTTKLEPNNNFNQVMDLECGRWWSQFDADIENTDPFASDPNLKPVVPYMSVRAVGDGTLDYYAFSMPFLSPIVSTLKLFIDIDYAYKADPASDPTSFDSMVILYNATNFNMIGFNDNDDPDLPALGSTPQELSGGSRTSALGIRYDAYLAYLNLRSNQDYIVVVGRNVGGTPNYNVSMIAPVPVNATYTLHISVSSHPVVFPTVQGSNPFHFCPSPSPSRSSSLSPSPTPSTSPSTSPSITPSLSSSESPSLSSSSSPSNSPSLSASSSPSSSSSPSVSPSLSPSITPSLSASTSPSISPSLSSSPTPSISGSASPSFSGSSSSSSSVSPSITPSLSASSSVTPSLSGSSSSSVSASITPSISPSVSSSSSPSRSPSLSPSITPSLSPSRTPSLSSSITPSLSTSRTPSLSASVTTSPSTTPSLSRSQTSSPSRSLSSSASRSATPSPTLPPSQSRTPSPGSSPAASASRSPSISVTTSRSPTTTPSTTPGSPSRTASPSRPASVQPGSPSPSRSESASPTTSRSPSPSLSPSPSAMSPSPSQSLSPSPSDSPSATSPSPSPSATSPSISPSPSASGVLSESPSVSPSVDPPMSLGVSFLFLSDMWVQFDEQLFLQVLSEYLRIDQSDIKDRRTSYVENSYSFVLDHATFLTVTEMTSLARDFRDFQSEIGVKIKGINMGKYLIDLCPEDPLKTEPGVCGCGTPDTINEETGIANCLAKVVTSGADTSRWPSTFLLSLFLLYLSIFCLGGL